ncbi:MAG: hypothetical protein EXR98_19390 [Gemmataceae bacterium]|nr:hypothetical protein [Gemmataceae bacterium]
MKRITTLFGFGLLFLCAAAGCNQPAAGTAPNSILAAVGNRFGWSQGIRSKMGVGCRIIRIPYLYYSTPPLSDPNGFLEPRLSGILGLKENPFKDLRNLPVRVGKNYLARMVGKNDRVAPPGI